MLTIFEFLSGEVPGGFPVLLAVLLAIHLTFSLLRGSDLISKKAARDRRIVFSLIVILVYVTLWSVLRPPQPRLRVMVLPGVGQEGTMKDGPEAFMVPEFFKRFSGNNLHNRYVLHRWEWAYETLLPDSVSLYTAWERLSEKLGSVIVIRSTVQHDGKVRLSVSRAGDDNEVTLEAASAAAADLSAAMAAWPSDLDLFKNTSKRVRPVNKRFIMAKRALLHRDFDEIPVVTDPMEDIELTVLYARRLLHEGLLVEVDRERARFTGINNEYFDRLKRLLYPLVNAKTDPPEVAVILGRVALWEEEFDDADVFFKKALTEDPLNSRIYYYLSSLLTMRLHELGFENRIELLEHAVSLDPAYNDAVHALAEEYYLTGTGTQTGTGTTNAIRVMEKFLKLQGDDPKILSLLATTYLKTDRLDDASRIYSRLENRFPDDSNLHYNKGIVSFRKKDYRKALDHFRQAIRIDQNLDAFLYMGLTYRSIGENDSALYYYRERVKRKTGADDIYAKEAMAGIRIILEEMQSDTLRNRNNAN